LQPPFAHDSILSSCFRFACTHRAL
jgi:hypothetical protein